MHTPLKKALPACEAQSSAVCVICGFVLVEFVDFVKLILSLHQRRQKCHLL